MAPVRAPREIRLCAGGHSSHVAPRSCAERERPSAAAVPSKVRKPTTTSVARRTRGKLACFATSRETAGAVARKRVPRESRLCGAGGHSSHVAPRSCTGLERPSAGAVPLYSTQADHNQRGTARARHARVFRHLLRDGQRSGACCSRATRNPAVRWRSQLARRTTVLRRKREASRR